MGTPLRSLLALRLQGRQAADDELLRRSGRHVDDGAVAAVSILAAQAAALLAVGEATEHSHHLEEALDRNRKIGMAIGVLMAYHKITQEEAFMLLRLASQSLHRKLRDIAAEVTETGTLPELPDASSRGTARKG